MALWLGGPAGAGKTTVARLLARRCGLRWYSTDLMATVHDRRARQAGVIFPPDGGPATYDRAPMIRHDLRALSSGPQVIVEGAIVTPTVPDRLADAVWLIPSKPEQLRRLRQRDPSRSNEAGCVAGYDEIIGLLSHADGVFRLDVDAMTVADTVDAVHQHFAIKIGAGRTATTVHDRAALARAQNEMVLAPLLRRSGSTDQPLPGNRLFDCECGAATCDQFVALTGITAREPCQSPSLSILAPVHDR